MPRVLFVVYTPEEEYMPKRKAELDRYPLWKNPNEEVGRIFVTPLDYEEKLEGVKAETVHFIEFTPNNWVEPELSKLWFTELNKVKKVIETIKIHNT